MADTRAPHQIDSTSNQGINEKCAVYGVSLTADEAVGEVLSGLLALQHRGQEGAGVAVAYENKIYCKKGIGLVSEVFSEKPYTVLPEGKTAVGHTRYSTAGGKTEENTGPFVTEYLTGRIATSHNGNITNAREIRSDLLNGGLQFNATCDSEVISSLISFYIVKEKDILQGITKGAELLEGSYSLAIATGGGKLAAVRDPIGFRPLCIGKKETGYAIASESCALDVCGYEFVRDVKPGEIILIENGKIVFEDIMLYNKSEGFGLCIFEYVYFARPDSVVDGLSVYNARVNMGAALANEYPVEADVVCGVPDSGLEAAMGYSIRSGIPLVSGFVKNRYIGRSFIYPSQAQRDGALSQKLNPLRATVSGKKVVLVDDSIVRGTTSKKIVGSLKAAGAKEVHMRVSSPPFRHVCHYGTDIANSENLMANNMGLDNMRIQIGADSLGFISLEGLKRACGNCTLPFCTFCFTG